MKLKRAVSYEKELKTSLKDTTQAVGYLKTAFEDPDKRVFLLALKDVIEARSGISKVARRAKLDRRHLYVMLSKEGNPEWFSINRLLNALDISITFEPMHQKESKIAA